MLKGKRLILPFVFTLILSSCAQNEAGNNQLDYEQTKKMVVDILKTDDGKKAIQEIMGDEEFKKQLVMDQAVVAETIEKTLTSDKGTEFWKKSFSDPKFAETMAKSMETENEKLLKNLMKDPQYRKMLVEIFKEPDLEKEVIDILKSNEYRAHLKDVITETFESPLFQAKIQDILMKAAEEIQKGGAQSQEQEQPS